MNKMSIIKTQINRAKSALKSHVP